VSAEKGERRPDDATPVHVAVQVEDVLPLRVVRPLLEALGLEPERVSVLVLAPERWSAIVVELDAEGRLVAEPGGISTRTLTGRVE
jgi:hypothetical protein